MTVAPDDTAPARPPMPDFVASHRVMCKRGHESEASAAFCATCGASLAPPSAALAVDSLETPPPSTARAGSRVNLAIGYVRGSTMRMVGVSAVVAGVVLLVSVLALTVGAAKTVTGTFTLFDSTAASQQCEGQGGYSDIGTGTAVRLSNERGEILGSGALDHGMSFNSFCIYTFTIEDVSADEKQYEVEVSHRGGIVQSRAEMEQNDWSFEVSLGK